MVERMKFKVGHRIKTEGGGFFEMTDVGWLYHPSNEPPPIEDGPFQKLRPGFVPADAAPVNCFVDGLLVYKLSEGICQCTVRATKDEQIRASRRFLKMGFSSVCEEFGDQEVYTYWNNRFRIVIEIIHDNEADETGYLSKLVVWIEAYYLIEGPSPERN